MTGASDLNLEINYWNEGAGLIDCYITFDGVTHKLWASGVFSPFPGLVYMMRALTANRLPYRFFWDEEGHGAHFEALPIADDSPNFRFKIQYDVDDSIWVDAELERKAMVDMLLAALRDFALYSRPPSRLSLGLSWEFSLADIIAFEEFRSRVIPPRSDIQSVEPIQLTLGRISDFQVACQWLDMKIWGIPLVTMPLPDGHLIWHWWFEWLEKILLGQFPAEVYFLNLSVEELNRFFLDRGAEPEPALTLPCGYTLRATAVDHPQHFRLAIIAADSRYRDFVKVDEVQDRHAFVGAFCAEFERMLEEEYEVLPDKDGFVFDLHDLPLKRLKTLLAKENPV